MRDCFPNNQDFSLKISLTIAGKNVKLKRTIKNKCLANLSKDSDAKPWI
ncbi:MAG: hypothetical protein K0R78_1593 [Pelosinus sp.]|jgi:hypothetical protein|nr:hypothetical protein [Pelosinus sp.]